MTNTLKIGLAVAGLWALILGGCSAAFAATPCGDRGRMVEHLEAKYGEIIVARMVQQNGSLLEITASPNTGTYSILLTRPGGTTCAVSVGDGFDLVVGNIGTPS